MGTPSMEKRSEKRKKTLLSQMKVGDAFKGTVKSITDCGAFVDLGGLDGFMVEAEERHGHRFHPSELLDVNQEIKVMVMSVDVENEKIELTLMPQGPSIWEKVESKYPVGTRTHGDVVKVVDYGAFVRLEAGIEGLLHISDMSSTDVDRPSELVQIGDKVDVVVLAINDDRQEISLGLNRTQAD
jgi:small subunit ribosomal protein S1